MRLRNRTNLLLYYTADEPDGSEDPVSTLVSTTAYINTLDPYRPSSLILNCQDYFFTNYSEGAPILMQDTYPIGINATYSTVYNTSCTREVGDCGCDNCRGGYEDIRDRMDDFTIRLEVLGRERSKTVWTVPQAFGSSSCVQTRYIRPPLRLVERTRGLAIEPSLISFIVLQILVAQANGSRVPNRGHHRHQCRREGLHLLE